MTNLYIPSSIKFVGSDGFWGIGGISENLEVNITDINAWLNIEFENDGSNPASFAKSFKLNGEEIYNLTIPTEIEFIKPYAFYNCANITNIEFPNILFKIGEQSLDGTGWYNKQDDGIIYANNILYKYKGDTLSTTSINVKEGTIRISSYAFFRCSGLESISFPSSLKYIDNDAFRGHKSLSKVVLNEGLEIIDEYAFNGCSLTDVEFPSTLKKIGEMAFNGTNLMKVKIPASVSSIGDNTFSSCEELISIEVDANNPYYDSRNNCNALIETATNTILQGCNNSFIPNTIKHIGIAAFNWCTSFTNIKIPNSVESIGTKAFYMCKNLEKISIPESVTELGDGVFYGCESLTEFYMPNSVRIVGNTLFHYCTSLNKVKLSDSIHKIGNWTFSNCSNLKSIELPAELDSIGTYAFTSCISLKHVIIPNNVKVIEEYAFNWCKGLTEITIGSGVEVMGQGIFRECDSLMVINSYIKNPQSISINTFKDYDQAILYVPIGTKSKYQSTAYWSRFLNIIEKFDLSGIEDLNIDNEIKAQYYNLQGVKVYNPRNGIFIKKQGSHTTKVKL